MGAPLVSYALCVYNGAPFVEEAIASVLNQAYPRIELIIVDDGSTDATPQILARVADPRVRVVSQPNMGLGFARNRAESLARGTYLGVMDADDVLLPEKTAVQLRTMRERGWDFSFTWAEGIDEQGKPCQHPNREAFNQPNPSQAEALSRLSRGNFLAATAALRHRRCAVARPAKVGFLCLDDYYRWLHLWRRFRGGVLEEPLLKVRFSRGSVSFDPRFTPQYRRFEEQAAKALAVIEGGRAGLPRLWWTAEQVNTLREQAEWLMSSGDPELGLPAYVVASRALSLSPLDARCYGTLSRILSWLGHEHPAHLLAERADRVAQVPPYPLPVLPSPLRQLYRRSRSVLGSWPRE